MIVEVYRVVSALVCWRFWGCRQATPQHPRHRTAHIIISLGQICTFVIPR